MTLILAFTPALLIAVALLRQHSRQAPKLSPWLMVAFGLALFGPAVVLPFLS